MMKNSLCRHMILRICTLPMVLLVSVFNICAQQDPLYTQYMFNTLAFNPAYAGSREMLSMMALSRHQWVGFEGAPSTQTITAHTPLGQKVGTGLSLLHDRLDPILQSGLYADYSYRLTLSDNHYLSLGLKGGFNYFQLDMAKLHSGEEVGDGALDVPATSKLLPNFGCGFYFYSPHYFFGASIPKIIENNLAKEDLSFLGDEGKEVRNYIIMGGAAFSIYEGVIFKPTFLAQYTQAAPMALDLNANFLFVDKLWVGAMYRIDDAFGVILQYQFSHQFKIGYAIDFTTSEIRHYSNGSHEIMVMYEFNYKRRNVKNPRYF